MDDAAEHPLITRDEALARGQLVLAVEDNSTNQKVIVQQLRLIGYAADLAEDGLQGLDRWRNGRYGLVLTDLHMPHLDGYRMVAALRDEEALAGRPRTPVVALTANAMKGEAERCLAAGIDDFLVKPVSLPRLKQVLDRWLRASGQPAPGSAADAGVAAAEGAAAAAAPDAGDARAAVDVRVLAALIGNRPALLRRFLADYRVHGERYLQQLLAALAAGSMSDTVAAAHKLKSSSRSVGALRLGELCEQAEAAGRADRREQAVALAPGLESTWHEVASRIDSLLADESSLIDGTAP